MSESAFQLTTRHGIEQRIGEALIAGDSDLMNEQLGIYPYGRARPEISLERAHEIASGVLKNATQITDEFEAVKLEGA